MFPLFVLMQSKIEKLKMKVETLETERDTLKESEASLEIKVHWECGWHGDVARRES